MDFYSSKIFIARTAIAVLAIFIVSIFIFFNATLTDLTSPKSNISYRLSKYEKSQLQEGDILLRKGQGFVSSAISELFESDYNLSHCGILIKKDNQWMVVHTVSSELSEEDGVKAELLNKFTHESVLNSLIVVRYNQSNEISKLVSYTKSLLSQNIPFDHSFDLNDKSEYYCTELIHRVFVDALDIDVFEERFETDHPDFIGFESFFNPQKFHIIINHQQ